MSRGDIKTKKGKISKGTYGVRRPRKRHKILRDTNGKLLQRGDTVEIPNFELSFFKVCYSTNNEYYFEDTISKMRIGAKDAINVKLIKR